MTHELIKTLSRIEAKLNKALEQIDALRTNQDIIHMEVGLLTDVNIDGLKAFEQANTCQCADSDDTSTCGTFELENALGHTVTYITQPTVSMCEECGKCN